MDQEATRVIRTEQYAYWKRMKGTGEHEFYDMQKDPEQENNLYGKQWKPESKIRPAFTENIQSSR